MPLSSHSTGLQFGFSSCFVFGALINFKRNPSLLGHRVEGGVGADGDIVAFSTLCAHKGYPLNYNATSRTLNCPGHYSVYDAEKAGLQIWGHAAQNLAQFRLRVDLDTGDIFAEGVDELIYGRTGNVLA